MSLVVHKYGGTSMGSVERIQKVAMRIKKWHEAGEQLVIVPSAMVGETNRLLGLAHEISDTPNPRELDALVATGEQVCSALLCIALNELGVPAVSFSGWQVPIYTDSTYNKARIISIDKTRILNEVQAGKVVVITGFQGVDQEGHVTTLGRGGSDTSAVAVATAIGAKECLIYTDVEGIYTTDPRVEPKAQMMSKIAFEEMLEMASLGSKVLQIRSVELAGKYNTSVRVLSSMTSPDMPLSEEKSSGTLMCFGQKMESPRISGIAFSKEQAKLTLVGVPVDKKMFSKILKPLSQSHIGVDMMIQSRSFDHLINFSFTVHRQDFQKAVDLLENEILPKVGAKALLKDARVSKVSIVGIGMNSHSDVATILFDTLDKEGIPLYMMSTNEIRMSVLIEDIYLEKAVRALHNAFNLHDKEKSSYAIV